MTAESSARLGTLVLFFCFFLKQDEAHGCYALHPKQERVEHLEVVQIA